MTKIVLVEKTGNKKDLNAKDLSREILYKKCGFRKAEGFEKRHTFEVKHDGVHSVEVWSRDSGRANTENKYDLPPPIDTNYILERIAIVGVDEIDELTDLDKATWEKVMRNYLVVLTILVMRMKTMRRMSLSISKRVED